MEIIQNKNDRKATMPGEKCIHGGTASIYDMVKVDFTRFDKKDLF